MQSALTLADFPNLPLAGFHRGNCPLCEGHNCASVNCNTRWFQCFKCNQSFSLTSNATAQRQERSEAELRQVEAQREKDLRFKRRAWKEIKPMPLFRTPGQTYLESRKIPLWLARQNGVQWAPVFLKRSGAILFPLKDHAGIVQGYQGRYITGTDNVRTLDNPDKTSKGLFMAGTIKDCFAITEAPIDALSYFLLFKRPCVAMLGTGNLPQWLIELAQGKAVYMASDNDEPDPKTGLRAGNVAALKWTNQLKGVASVERHTPELKDWNEQLTKGELK